MIPLGSTACFNAIAQADSGLTGIMRMSEDTSRISTYGEISMDQRDWELLDRQLCGSDPCRRNDGVTVFTVVAVFFAGMTLFAHESKPMRVASNLATVMAQARQYIGVALAGKHRADDPQAG